MRSRCAARRSACGGATTMPGPIIRRSSACSSSPSGAICRSRSRSCRCGSSRRFRRRSPRAGRRPCCSTAMPMPTMRRPGGKSIELGGRELPGDPGRAPPGAGAAARGLRRIVPRGPGTALEPLRSGAARAARRLRLPRAVDLRPARAGAMPAPGLCQVNAHLDPVDWRGSRLFVGEAAALERLCARARSRGADRHPQPPPRDGRGRLAVPRPAARASWRAIRRPGCARRATCSRSRR